MTTLLSILVLAMGPFATPVDGPVLCADPPGQIEMAFDPGIGEQSYCTAEADCASGTVSCSGNTACFAYDRNCPSTQGYVECDGNRTYCPEPCCTVTADCTEGPDVSCSGNSCSAVDQSCPSTQGYVECDGSRTYCPLCCTFFQCISGCSCPGGLSHCFDLNRCECRCISN